MNVIIQKYGVGIFSFLISVLTAVQVMNHFGLVDILQLVVIIITSFTAYMLKLFPTGWRGGLKTGADVLGILVLAAIPLVLTGMFTGPQIVLVIIGVIKALATEFGVQIRTDAAIGAAAVTVINSPDPGVPASGVAEPVV